MKPNLHIEGCVLVPAAPHYPGVWMAYKAHDANQHVFPGHPMFRHRVKYLVRTGPRDWWLTEMQLNRKPGKPVAHCQTRRDALKHLN
jgi:hypothetical protein